MLQDSVAVLIDTIAKDTAVVAHGLAGKTGAWYDRPALIAVLGMAWHTYIKWQDVRRRPGQGHTSFASYAFARERTGALIFGLTLIGAWTVNVGFGGFNVRDVVPYHAFSALALGYMMDSIIKETVKKLPFLGEAFGIKARRTSTGDLTLSDPMPAVPPPPGFEKKEE